MWPGTGAKSECLSLNRASEQRRPDPHFPQLFLTHLFPHQWSKVLQWHQIRAGLEDQLPSGWEGQRHYNPYKSICCSFATAPKEQIPQHSPRMTGPYCILKDSHELRKERTNTYFQPQWLVLTKLILSRLLPWELWVCWFGGFCFVLKGRLAVTFLIPSFLASIGSRNQIC